MELCRHKGSDEGRHYHMDDEKSVDQLPIGTGDIPIWVLQPIILTKYLPSGLWLTVAMV